MTSCFHGSIVLNDFSVFLCTLTSDFLVRRKKTIVCFTVSGNFLYYVELKSMIFSVHNLPTTGCLKCLVLGINKFNMAAPVRGTLLQL